MTDFESKLAQNLWSRYGGSPGAFSASPMIALSNRLTPPTRLPLLSTLQRRLSPDHFSSSSELVDITSPQPPVQTVAARQVLQRRAISTVQNLAQHATTTPFGAAGVKVGTVLLRNLAIDASSSPTNLSTPQDNLPGQAKGRISQPVSTIQRQAVALHQQSAGEGPVPKQAAPTSERSDPSLIQRIAPHSSQTLVLNQTPMITKQDEAAPIQRVVAVAPVAASSPLPVVPEVSLEPAIRRRPSPVQRQAVPTVNANFSMDGLGLEPASSLMDAAPARLVFPHPKGEATQSVTQRKVEASLSSENAGETQSSAVIPRKHSAQTSSGMATIPMPLANPSNRAPAFQADLQMPLALGTAPVIQTVRDETPVSARLESPRSPSRNLAGSSETNDPGLALNLDLLVDKVLQQLMRRLAVERERKGGRRWP